MNRIAGLALILSLCLAGAGIAQTPPRCDEGESGAAQGEVEPFTFSFATGQLELPVVYIPDAGSFRVTLRLPDPALPEFELENAIPTCDVHPDPATFSLASGELRIPMVTVGGEAFEVRLDFMPGAGPVLFQLQEVWPEVGVALDCLVGAASCAEGGPVPPDAERSFSVMVFGIGAQYFPVAQFRLAGPDRCPESHYHITGFAVSVDQGQLADPDPTRCGFGTVSSLVPMQLTISGTQVQAWEETTGLSLGAQETGTGTGTETGVGGTSVSNGGTSVSNGGTVSGGDDGDDPRDTPPPTLFGEEIDPQASYCGPDINNVLLQALRRIKQRVANLPASEIGWYDGTGFLERNGVNIDFQVRPKRNANDESICPTESCTAGDGQRTITLCGTCVMAHIANDILYGFVSNLLEVPFSIQLLGAHYAEYASYGSLDPLSSQAAYRMGNLAAEAMGGNADLTVEEMCSTFDNARLRTGFRTAPLAFELMTAEQPFLSTCALCPFPCEADEVLKDFSITGWHLDDGTDAVYQP
ncbi:MAG: hypothetical protein HYY96_00020 [Candidatus Tectomicrobia bacterium]|nr:hypothetical protein [Candidatus Tectomicrobia bacterium]